MIRWFGVVLFLFVLILVVGFMVCFGYLFCLVN